MNQFVSKKKYLVFLVLFTVLAIALLLPFSAMAQSPCEQIIIDEPNAFSNQTADVQAAANQLINTGADVRIRVIQTYGSAGNLDRYETSLEQQCPSWTDSSGNRKNNLVVIMLSLQEKQSGIYYGSQWDPALGNQWTQIQTNIMNPHFTQGDYAGGVIAGLNEINRLIQAQLSGSSGSQGAGGISTGLIVFFVILFIIALVVGLVIFRNYSKTRERQQAVRQKALLAKQGAASKVNSLVDSIQMLEIKVNAMAAKVSPEDAAPLLDGFNKAKKLVDQGAQNYGDLGHSAGDPSRPKLSESQLQVIGQEYQKVLDTLNQAENEVNQVEQRVDTLQQAVEGFNNHASETSNAIQAALQKQESAQNAGLKAVDSVVALNQANQSLSQAQNLYRNKQFLQSIDKLNEANALAAQAAKSVDELPAKKQEAETAIRNLEPRINQVKGEIDNGRTIFERISSTYAESSWEPIRGNGTEAENRIDWTLEALDKAREAAAMDKQDWSKALDLIKQGNAWLDEAESFMRSISALETNLAAAQRDASGEITAAQADITKAWNYINQYDEDIRESLEDDLHAAEKKLATANEELRKEKADYLSVVTLARDANTSADKILDQARSEHEEAERIRTKAVSSIRDARSRVSIAKEYIEDHVGEAGDEARNYLAGAVTALQQAEATSDLNTRIALAEKAESAANLAYNSAKKRVDEIWARREPAFPGVIIFPGGGFGGRNSSWGSHRSSPWSWGSGSGTGGRSGGGGGGSTHWGGGGGGRGGGGSHGW